MENPCLYLIPNKGGQATQATKGGEMKKASHSDEAYRLLSDGHYDSLG